MGGRGSGGHSGVGRKPKTVLEHAISGDAGRRGRVLSHPSSTAPVEIEIFDAPEGLTDAEKGVWAELAPYAFRNRTLTRATVLAFTMLCRNVVIEREIALTEGDRGGPNHRGVIQRIDAELSAFSLRPLGKPLLQAEADKPAANPLERFIKRG